MELEKNMEFSYPTGDDEVSLRIKELLDNYHYGNIEFDKEHYEKNIRCNNVVISMYSNNKGNDQLSKSAYNNHLLYNRMTDNCINNFYLSIFYGRELLKNVDECNEYYINKCNEIKAFALIDVYEAAILEIEALIKSNISLNDVLHVCINEYRKLINEITTKNLGIEHSSHTKVLVR